MTVEIEGPNGVASACTICGALEFTEPNFDGEQYLVACKQCRAIYAFTPRGPNMAFRGCGKPTYVSGINALLAVPCGSIIDWFGKKELHLCMDCHVKINK